MPIANGDLADAQLRALIDVAAAAAGAHRLEDVLELAAERALEVVGGSSLAISRWDPEAGVVRTLINVGELGPGEERFPKNETYSIADYPSVETVIREHRSSLAVVDDPATDRPQRELLRRLGKESSLSVPMMLRGGPWGELWVTTAPGVPRLVPEDAVFLRAVADQLVAAIHRAELFDRIEALAYTDSLTDVANRRATERALEEACDAPSGPGAPALVLCDIDDLKGVNDSDGHQAGDEALVRTAKALEAAAGGHPDAVVGRIGGDEFCVLLPSGTAEDARRVALDAVHRLATQGPARISCGVAARSELASRPAALLRAADEAQYRAKRAGPDVDVVVAGEGEGHPAPANGRDRAYRAGSPAASLARDLLALLDEPHAASPEAQLDRLRARLEREL